VVAAGGGRPGNGLILEDFGSDGDFGIEEYLLPLMNTNFHESEIFYPQISQTDADEFIFLAKARNTQRIF
jgi:hypothetical protein